MSVPFPAPKRNCTETPTVLFVTIYMTLDRKGAALPTWWPCPRKTLWYLSANAMNIYLFFCPSFGPLHLSYSASWSWSCSPNEACTCCPEKCPWHLTQDLAENSEWRPCCGSSWASGRPYFDERAGSSDTSLHTVWSSDRLHGASFGRWGNTFLVPRQSFCFVMGDVQKIRRVPCSHGERI